MDKIVLRVVSDTNFTGTRKRTAYALEYNGYFTHLPPAKRKRTAAYVCRTGGETTLDYWYCHDTGKQGDVKLCRIHEVEEQYELGCLPQ